MRRHWTQSVTIFRFKWIGAPHNPRGFLTAGISVAPQYATHKKERTGNEKDKNPGGTKIFALRVRGPHGGGIKATFCFEQDAKDYARQIGGTVYTIGAIK